MDINERREQLDRVLNGLVTDPPCGNCDHCILRWPDISPVDKIGILRDTCELMNSIIKMLHDLGLVFKVEGELPEINTHSGSRDYNSYHREGQEDMRDSMIKAGYTKTAPIIIAEEGK